MAKLVRKIRRALDQDSESIPMDNFSTISSSVPPSVSNKLAALAEVLEANPQTRGPTQVYLTWFISKTQRQVGGEQALFETFAKRYAETSESTLEALPEHTREALSRIAELKEPFPVSDPMLLAHGLTIDGELCRLVAELSGEPVKPKETGPAVARRLLAKHHPDKGGDAETFAAVSEMYRALK